MSLLMVRKYAPAHAADKIEKIAQDSAIVAMWQVLGDAEAYLREGKKNHNVKNVLAAAIKAAEKENPNDRSIAEAKKVLAQFDAGDEVIAQKNGYKLVHNTLNDGYWFYTKSGAGWGLTATNKVAAVNEFNRLVDSAKDSAADADKSEELEREIKGDVVAVVSGNAARVSKDVSFAAAKEGVESFARKNGVSVIASQEYGEAYKFKFSAAIDCAADAAAQDAYISFPTPPANGKPFPQEARIIEKLKKEMMDFASHVEDAAHHFDFVANVNKRGNTLEEQELYDFYRAWEHKCDSIRAALH